MNKRLLEDADIIDYPLSYQTNVKAKCSDWRVESENTLKIESWILKLLEREHSWFSGSEHKIHFVDSFFVRYDEDEWTRPHDHIPSQWSWIYYIRCPKGSSPLIFPTSGKRIKPEEGQLVIFPACVTHWVPKNRCKDRVALVGNIEIAIHWRTDSEKDGVVEVHKNDI